MRTTLNIDDDVLITAQLLARQQRRSLGALVSELLRRALSAGPVTSAASADAAGSDGAQEYAAAALGLVPYRAAEGGAVTSAEVNALRDQEGI